MRKWLIKQIEKIGLDSSNLKTEAELQGRFLQVGEAEKIIFPQELDLNTEWRIKEWYFEKGQVVKPGDVIGAIGDEKQRFEFETFVGGRLNYFKALGQKVEGGSVLVEITGF